MTQERHLSREDAVANWLPGTHAAFGKAGGKRTHEKDVMAGVAGTAAFAFGDCYLTLRSLAEYSGISIRSLRNYIKGGVHPLPSMKPNGKILVRRSDFDRWIAQFRVEPEEALDLDDIVESMMRPH